MKRRTLKQLRSKLESLDHHNVYVVLLDPAVGKLRTVRSVNPKRDRKKLCVYVGMTGLTPEERFANHKAGIKAAALVTRYGLRLLPELLRASESDAVRGGSEDGSGFGGGLAPGRIYRHGRALNIWPDEAEFPCEAEPLMADCE